MSPRVLSAPTVEDLLPASAPPDVSWNEEAGPRHFSGACTYMLQRRLPKCRSSATGTMYGKSALSTSSGNNNPRSITGRNPRPTYHAFNATQDMAAGIVLWRSPATRRGWVGRFATRKLPATISARWPCQFATARILSPDAAERQKQSVPIARQVQPSSTAAICASSRSLAFFGSFAALMVCRLT